MTVVRPGDVYGPGSRPWTVLPVQLIKKYQFLLPAMGNGIFSPVYVDDLVDGLILAATSPAGAGHSITKARRLLGYEPAVDLPEGMARTGAWLRAEGLIP